MKTLLSLALLAVFAFPGCTHESGRSVESRAHRDREFNNESGNFERNPPFGPRSNKTLQ